MHSTSAIMDMAKRAADTDHQDYVLESRPGTIHLLAFGVEGAPAAAHLVFDGQQRWTYLCARQPRREHRLV